MVLIQCPADRWLAHRYIAEHYSNPDGTRGHLWRFCGEGEAVVRIQSDPITIPEVGTPVTFSLDFVPLVSSKGKRKLFPTTDEFGVQWAMQRFASALDITEIAGRVMTMKINRDGNLFSRPAARVLGRARVLDRDYLEQLMRKGIGDAKAYGYGMLEVKEA